MAGTVEDQVRTVMEKYKVPEWIWKPIMIAESGGNPQATNISGNEYSLGLFQVNLKAHPEYAKANLLDPVVNAEIAARDFLAPAYEQARKAGLARDEAIAYVWKEGLKPAWDIPKENFIRGIARQLFGESVVPEIKETPGIWNPPSSGGLKEFIVRGIMLLLVAVVGIYSLTQLVPVDLPVNVLKR